MTNLVKEVRDILKVLETDKKKKSSALENAEVLADKFRDVKVRTDVVPIEKYFGLPEFQNDKYT